MKKILCALVLAQTVLVGRSIAQNRPTSATVPSAGTQTLYQYPANFSSGILVNKLRTIVPQVPAQSRGEIDNLSMLNKNIATVYTDGLGRQVQKVMFAASPNLGDVVSVDFYDSNGRRPVQLLDYVSGNTDGNFKKDAFSAQSAFFANGYNSLSTGDNAYPYSSTSYDDENLLRTVSAYKPGAAKVGKLVGRTRTSQLNTAQEKVRQWTFLGASAVPASYGEWAALSLFVTELTDENGKRKRVYRDIEGKTILVKKEGSTAGITAHHDGWLCTYFVYDEYSRLRQVISPKAVEAAKNAGWNISTTLLNNLCTSYDYDYKSRLIYKKLPGRSPMLTIYDRSDRPVLVQDGNLSGTNQWLFTKYDGQGRIVVTGKYLNPSSNNDPQLRSILTGTSSSDPLLQFLIDPLQVNTFTSASTIAGAEIYSLNYFDNYDHVPSISAYDDGQVQGLAPGTNVVQSDLSNEVTGLSTGTSIRVMNGNSVSADWEHSVNYYNSKGRLIQIQSTNFLGGSDVVSMNYNFSGSILNMRSVQYNPNVTGPQSTTNIFKQFLYDRQGRLRSIMGKVNDEPNWRRISGMGYDAIGDRLLNKYYGSNAESQTFKYRIWGALESINKEFSMSGTGNNYFGEVLSYDYGFNKTDKVNASGMRWRLKGSSNIERAYGYSYDDAGRLTNADYSRFTVAGLGQLGWSNYYEDFSAKNMAYDANGNLTHMDQWATLYAATGNVRMDALDYRYKDGGQSNQLQSVTDAETADYGQGEFTEPVSARNPNNLDYAYDANGNATKDGNREITSISYNYFNKPYQISFTNGRTINFGYDAAGILLSKEILETGHPSKNFTYLNGLEYEDNVLKSIAHDEGRVRPVKVTLANNTTVWSYEYDFFIKDHQGNVRSVVTEEVDNNWWTMQYTNNERMTRAEAVPCPTCKGVPTSGDIAVVSGYTMGTRTYLVTNELPKAAVEEALFDNVSETRDVKQGSVDPNDQKETHLKADLGKIIGPSLLIPVSAGDKITVQTAAMYEDRDNPDYQSQVPIEQLVANLVTALSGEGGYNTINEGGLSPEITSGALTQSQFLAAMQEVKAHNAAETGKPQAFLNYVMLDQDMQVVDGESGFVQTKQAGDWNQLSVPEMEMNRSGYMLVFLSNESNISVHFDNLNVTHYKGKLLEENHYYPYGLTLTKKAFSLAASNNKLFAANALNNKEFSNGSGLNWYATSARQYDPQIGRFHSSDPLGENSPEWSGYRYAYGNPVSFTDPNGREEEGDDGDGPYGTGQDVVGGYHESWGADVMDRISDGIGNVLDAVADAVTFVLSKEGDPDWDGHAEATEVSFDTFDPGGDPEDRGWEPLDKATLLNYARTLCPTCGPGGLQTYTGNLFENAWTNTARTLGMMGSDNYRSNSEKVTGGTRATVPDGISDGWINPGFFSSNIRVPNASFFEVKAMNGDIYNSTSTGQVMGHITNLAATVPYQYRFYGKGQQKLTAASLTFITTDNVEISPSVIATATLSNIIVYQYKAQYMMLGPVMVVRFELYARNAVKLGTQVTPPVRLR